MDNQLRLLLLKMKRSADWLNFVATSKARSSIRFIRKQKISQARKAGKLLLESELKRGGATLDQYRGSDCLES